MRDWVEFNQKDDGKKVSLRPSYVTLTQEGKGCTRLHLDTNGGVAIDVIEPYDEVMKKLKEAEEYELPPVVEHFTRDEYATILATLKYRMSKAEHWPGELVLIENKLEKILKGEE